MARPVTACRPQGPPTASLACTATGSVQVGTTRSGHGGAATCGNVVTGRADTPGPAPGARPPAAPSSPAAPTPRARPPAGRPGRTGPSVSCSRAESACCRQPFGGRTTTGEHVAGAGVAAHGSVLLPPPLLPPPLLLVDVLAVGVGVGGVLS